MNNEPNIGAPIRMSCAEFEAMPVTTDKTSGAPYRDYRILWEGRWHTINRQYSCGFRMIFVNPIILRIPAAVS